MQKLEQVKPRHWYEMLRGILNLEKQYDRKAIDLSCARALLYGAVSYREIKNILEQQLYQHLPEEGLISQELINLGGYGHDLSAYDKL
jgi:hypothetical protein